MDALPALAEVELNPIISMAALTRMARADVPGLIAQMLARPGDADIFMSLSRLFLVSGNEAFALEMQAQALARSAVYRIAATRQPIIRLLALMGPGDMTDNTPLDYLIEDTDIRLDLLYIVPGQPLPHRIPEHDAAIVALGESARNRPMLQRLHGLLAHWPRPLLNRPEHILLCSRDSVSRLLADIPGLLVPPVLRIGRQQLERVARLSLPAAALIAGSEYPITLRPLDVQCGEGLGKIGNAQELAQYLAAASDQEFFVSVYVDYRSADGLYRKARIALIDGLPYVCHLAISEHWIVHYQSAGMDTSSARREEEAAFMHDFDSGFALRHQQALRAIGARLALDYAVIDCAETRDGKLLVFEADNRGWVHATDPAELYPYKAAHMNKAFAAFRAMLLKAKR